MLFLTVPFAMVRWSKPVHVNRTLRAGVKGHSCQRKLRFSQAMLGAGLNNLQESGSPSERHS